MSEEMKNDATKLGEIFSQCWESEEFKQNFKDHPKEVLKEYDIAYDENLEYVVMDSPEKTVTYVLPYENVKQGMQIITDNLMHSVNELEDESPKQVIPEGWVVRVMQNTEDVCYIIIPVSPENLTPEELELVNGGILGFFVAVVVFLVAGVALVVGFMGVGVLSAAAAVAIDVVAIGHVAACAVTVAT